jgi:hypothetical protein
MNIELKISNFFDELIRETNVDAVLNQTFLTLSEKVGVGLDAMIKSLHNQCILDEGFENGWNSADGKHHLAVICVNNDDSQEHCFGEWLESAQGVIVLEPNRDNQDAEEKAKHFLQGRGYMVYASAESEIEDLRDCGYLVIKDGDKGSSSILDVVSYLQSKEYDVFAPDDSIAEFMRGDGWYVVWNEHFVSWATDIFKNMNYKVFDIGADGTPPIIEYLEARGYISFHADNINKFCIEHLTQENYFICNGDSGIEELVKAFQEDPKKANDLCIEHLKEQNYFVCDGDSDIESLVKLYKEEPNKFSNILQKTYRFRIDSLHKFNISCEVKSFSYQNAHIEMRKRLDVACITINNSQDLIRLNADLIQIISM